MPYLAKYHLGEQHVSALLGPVVDTLRELEHRTAHHARRLPLSDANQQAILAAHRAIAAARAEVERLREGTTPTRGSNA